MSRSVLRSLLSLSLTLVLIACGPSQIGAAAAGEDLGAYDEGAELLANGGFEDGGSPVPSGWSRDLDRTGGKGEVVIGGDAYNGSHSLRLEPSGRNDEQNPLALSQLIPATAYRGKQVAFSGYLSAEGGATAIIGMLTIAGGRASNLVLEAESGSAWTEHRRVYAVPDLPDVQLAFTVMANGTSGVARFDNLSVVPLTPRPTGGDVPTDGAKHHEGAALNAALHVDAGTAVRDIPETLFGTNIEWRWNATMLWQEKQDRLDPELVRLSRDLGVTLIRFPGGVYSDFYHWRAAVGPRDKRPEMKHEPGKDDKSRPNFGTDEALEFARSIGAELLITVNAGTGTAQEAADWVRYVNQSGLRVRYWEVGNELYMTGDSPTNVATVDPATYADRFLTFARAMRAADPRIKIGAIGGENQGRYQVMGYPDWNRILLQKAGSEIDFLAVHNAYAPVGPSDRQDVRTVYRAMLAAPVLLERNLELLTRQIAQYVPGRASEIDIAVTEWGPFFHVDFNSRFVDHPKTLGSALFTASVLKELIESPKTTIANFWMLHDWSVLGAIGSRNPAFPPNPDWVPTARYYAIQLFTKHFGTRLVTSRVNSPTFDSEAAGWIDAVKDVPFLDAVSSLSEDGGELYIIAINKNFDSAIDASITVAGFDPAGDATAWTLTGSGIDAHTGTEIIKVPGLRVANQAEDSRHRGFSKGSPQAITFGSSPAKAGSEFVYRFPPRSVTSLRLTRAAVRRRAV